MAAALALAGRGLGRVWPNPAVGCVLVDDGRVVGRGWTQPGGRPHAETEALARAGDLARGATAYVSLEPCSHHGRTPPCADALVAAGVARVVMAVEDPDPRVSGRGAARLREAGIAVTTGVRENEARALNAGFFLRVTAGRPLVTLKLASTLDGRIAMASGESRWITGDSARAHAHRLRAEHDAVMVGIGTALADDPDLTCRLPGLSGHSPVRAVVDSRFRLPPSSRLVATAHQVPTWIIGCVDSPVDLGPSILGVPADADGHVDLRAALAALGGRGITRVLVEGGGHLAAALLRQGLVDRLVWFHAPRVIGGEGIPAVAAMGLDRLADSPMFTRTATVELGDDLMELYERR
ncbi:MAG: bifunctional diaminohydroxyphosphoribosylaminopyrimidine deaminase/5-amino-6-(5-phosphoribosylamino)uracil reductase RibD [Alphaproteobacteria bacterium]